MSRSKGNSGKNLGKSVTKTNIERVGDGKTSNKTKILQEGKKTQDKKWAQKPGIKKEPSKVAPKTAIKAASKPTPAKGLSKLKTTARVQAAKSTPTKTTQAPKKANNAKGVSKLKATAAKAISSKKSPAKSIKPPSKGR